MIQRIVTRFPGLAVLAALVALPATLTGADARNPVNVFAASSLTDVVARLAPGYCETAGLGPECIRGVFAASSTLARQISQGAPADVYLTADGQWMDLLESAGRIRAEERITFAGNRLAVIQPLDRTAAADAADALGTGRIALGDPAHVPAGTYAREALTNLGLWPGIRTRIVPADNTRQALLLVERGEVDAGIVYRSDALASSRVRVIAELPAESHPPIRYHAAPVAGAGDEATAFVRYLAGPAARADLQALGFGDQAAGDD